jgi:hypothetical protein
MYGDGIQSTQFKADINLDDAVMRFATNAEAIAGLNLSYFQINGDKLNQTDAVASRGLYLDRSGGSADATRHYIHHLHIRGCLSDGLYGSGNMSANTIHDMTIYQNDGEGMYLITFSDNKVYNIDVGQSGKNGVRITGGTGIIHMWGIISWFSGENNYNINNSGIVASNLESQEGNEHGFLIDNSDGRVIELSACVADSDNRSQGAFNAMQLIDCEGANIQLTVLNRAGEGKVANGVVNGIDFLRDVFNCNIDLHVVAAKAGVDLGITGKPVAGVGLGSNDIRVNGRPMHFITMADDFLGGVLKSQWNGLAGTDPQALVPAINPAVNGSVRLETGNDAAASMAVNGSQMDSGLSWRASNGGLVFEARLSIRESAITDVALFIGFTDQVSVLEMPIESAGVADTIVVNANDAVGFMYDTDMATDNWWQVGVAGGVPAIHVDVGSAPAQAVFETFRIILAENGAANFFVNGVLIGSQMAGAVGGTVPLTPVVATFSRGAASRNIDIEYIRVQQLRNDYI